MVSEIQTWWATELYPTKDAENFGIVGDYEVMRVEDVQTLRDERDRLQRLINIYAKAKVVFDEGRLREDHHAWKERYQALVSAEGELKAALTPAGGGKDEK